VKRERIEEGINQVQQELVQTDARLRECEKAAGMAWRFYLGGLAGLLLGINLVLVLWPLGASLILGAVAAAVYGRIANRRALREMKDLEERIYRLKEELSKLQSLLEMA
jgi:predicted phage tail protein